MIVLIPARIGSKGVALKNIRMLGNFPLVCWSIAAGKLLSYSTVVSCDNWDVFEIVKRYKGVAHFRRSGGDDNSTDVDVVKDFLTNQTYIGVVGEIIYLRPTTPFRNPVLLKEAVEKWRSGKYDSLCSGHVLPESADKFMKHDSIGKFIPYNPAIKLSDIHNPRQSTTETIQTNGVIDIFRTDKVADGILWGNNMLGFITPYTQEIENEEDLEYCNWLVAKNGHPLLDYMRAIW